MLERLRAPEPEPDNNVDNATDDATSTTDDATDDMVVSDERHQLSQALIDQGFAAERARAATRAIESVDLNAALDWLAAHGLLF